MAINPSLMTLAPSLQQGFVDKTTGLPLSGGKVYFWQDNSRSNPKSVYELQGNSANYTFVPLPNPVILSGIGTIMDSTFNDVIPYYYPVNIDNDAIEELYFIEVYDSLGQFQFSRQGFPGPNLGSGANSNTSGLINYIPNGQFLAHTNLPDNALVGGTNVIAQGGFTVELQNTPGSVNTLVFNEILTFTENPTQSPRWEAVLTCDGTNPAETIKAIRIKWKDVNKFSTTATPFYTFAFYANCQTSIQATIQTYKFFGTGGNPTAPVEGPPQQFTIDSDSSFSDLQFDLDFFDNSTAIIGSNDDDYVAVQINLPVNVAFSLTFTDFVMVDQQSEGLTGFPIQTNADMLTRGVMGWVDTPNPDGSDLFLAPILTQEGMTWDHSVIGNLSAFPLPIDSPTDSGATIPFIPCNGDSYIDSDYSTLGIPFSRLGTYLRTNGFVDNYPAYGTGTNYATGWAEQSNTNAAYIIVNSPGTPVNIATNVNTTGITYSGVITYNGAQIGRAAYGYDGNWNGSTGVIALGNFLTPANGGAFTQNVASFNPTALNTNTGLLAFQNYGFSLTCTAASTLPPGGGNYASITFNNSAGTIAINYRIAMASSGLATGTVATIIIDLDGSESDAQVAQLTSYAISALQVSKLVVGSLPPDGSSFTFQSNPAAIRTLQAYFAYSDSTPAPNPAVGELVRIVVPSSPTTAIVATAIYDSINSYQYAVPDLEGMFLRGVDPNSNFDLDRLSRLSQGVGPGGLYGSYQLDQFLSHNHIAYQTNTAGPIYRPTITPATDTITAQIQQILNSGGTETRPVNSYVYWGIRY